ncbi:MAG: pyridoxine/pyridoxamine 5'-phosphate oxidase [Gaiellaceae bacterium]|nr:MAG: pyridoxine/pyridoxamine 5'-phosphate oxidase [Gaiellaceae bacterium]
MDERDLDPDPIAAVRTWLEDARAALPGRWDAMTLATASADGQPSARMVLLRGFDDRGAVFFTNRTSRKGRELAENPRAALVLHWWELGRQVRIEGQVEQVADAESEAYWRSRPRASRIAAWASPQSRPLRDRAELDAAFRAYAARFEGGEVPLPPFWGGFRVVPEAIELWTHADNRLHDRVRYVRAEEGWRRERLAP